MSWKYSCNVSLLCFSPRHHLIILISPSQPVVALCRLLIQLWVAAVVHQTDESAGLTGWGLSPLACLAVLDALILYLLFFIFHAIHAAQNSCAAEWWQFLLPTPFCFHFPHIFYSYIVRPPFHLRSHFFCSCTLHTSFPLSIHPFVYVALPPSASTCNTFCPVGSWQAPRLFCSGSCSPSPTFLLLFFLLLSSRFRMCARVRGARHCVRANGLKGNAYVIANCLQSLGAALKKDMPRRQLRLFAFASLSDCICFKGFVRIIFNPTALWALCTMASGGVHN